ncbi:MAG: magnesium chelatase subunit H [Roseococcus sp.]|nr:magnesium chelatase subunit H [Roseococcus sp.]
MTQKHISPAKGGQPLHFVIVTMDGHFGAAVERAQAELSAEMPGLRLIVHSADEWASDPHALAACHADIAKADIILSSMLFLDDHVRMVMPALLARRPHCAAMVGMMSAGEVVKLTRLKKFDMSAEATGVLGMLKRLRGSKGPRSSGKGQMKMLKELPKFLRFIPGVAQDVRAYMLCLQYWLAGSSENLANLVRLLAKRYADAPVAQPAAPIEYPEIGLYHPRIPGLFADDVAKLPRMQGKGRVGLLLLRSYVLAGNAGHYNGVIAEFERRGLEVVPAFASGLDQRPAVERFFMQDGKASVDAVVSLTGFSLVGGPAYNDARAAEEMLAQLDVPYVGAHPLEFQPIFQWRKDARGLTPVEATMMVALPELDGAIMPMTFGGRCGATTPADRCPGCDGVSCGRDMVAHHERAGTLAQRVGKIIALRRKERAERRVGIVIFNFPPNGGNTGTAAYLSVFESLHATMLGMKAEGYAVDVPESVDALREAIINGNRERYGSLANVGARVSTDEHVRKQRWLGEIEKQWGPAPGRQQSDGASIHILGERFGNVFVGVQPGFGYEGDPMRLLFEQGFAPTHAFAAFYRWMSDEFQADAVLHFGTHGALEFMPGKQAGMSAECWPDRLIGDLPNFYLYASNNPSEGMLAKRRAGATLISYLTPPVASAGLYRGLMELKASLDRWRTQDPDADETSRASMAQLIQAQAAAVELAAAEPAWAAGDYEVRMMKLKAELLELEYTLIPHGLHALGKQMSAEQRVEMLDAAGVTDAAERERLDQLLATEHEIPAILHALDGRYTRPAPGGDLLRTTDVLPTGRNLHGFDPFAIPSVFAVKDGAQQAERLLERHTAAGAPLPETIAMVLWGTDNLKTEGGPIAQALWLMGAEPRHDAYGRLCGAQLVPLEKLGRPRIDVMISLSGIFRDLLPLQTKLLAEAALFAAEADEAPEMNFIRKHALACIAQHGGTMEDAALRIFGNADGTYGANVNQIVDNGSWQDEDELAEAYMKRKGYAYGADGRPRRHDVVMNQVLSTVECTYQNLDSVESGITTISHYFDSLGGMSRAVLRVRGQEPSVYIGDQTRGAGTIRSLAEQVSLETRTRALNPKWFEAMLAHGYEGVRQIEEHVTNTMGWSATTGQVQPWVYQHLAQTYMLDEEMRARLANLNPTASAKIANRLIEATERAYWAPDAATLEALRRAGEELEDRLEGISPEMAA